MRVLVFRPQSDAEKTAQAISGHGFEPLVAPLFKVVPLNAEAPQGDFAAIVVTSGNAVPMLAGGPAAWRALPVFTVGTRTAAKVRAAGMEDARSADGDRNDLIALIERTLPAPSAILLVVGRDRKEDVAQRLSDAGYEVSVWEAYAAEALDALPEEARAALQDGKADAALHYSARGAGTFLDLARKAGVFEPALELTHVVISADAAAPLIAAGASTVLVAEHPEEAGMLAALEQVSQRGAATEAPRASPQRTPPTIDLQAEPATEEPAKPEDAGDHPPEAVAPTEALPREFTPPPPRSATEPPAASTREERRLPWGAIAAAGVIGGVVGAGLMLFALRASSPAITPEQLADISGRVDGLQAGIAASDRKASSAAEAAGKAGSEVQALAGRIGSLAQGGDPAAIQRAQAAATAAGQKVDQLAARLGTVETQAKTAAAASPEAMAAARIVLAERVARALDEGKAFAGDVAALARGGIAQADLAPLSAVASTGAATRSALQAGFRKHGAMFQREVTPQSGSWSDRLWGLASRIVTVRPVGDNGSNDPATLPLRIESAIASGDMPKAAALWAQLPEPARRASAEFGEALQKRAAADAAIAKIGQDAVAALGAAG
ncbi:uroporphyrinogen-III synthase [Bosea sp. TND4EK4]|uniref:uroporphyrinogen-III synthase n=1 Tax=Bosea sp. TND4EK4 TaxID=1907408 RepID=UPI0009562BCC|nr:uroporphyrinogen-III synthase [Bosea sp. TND4EK4]SIR14283.1 Uroporphyrinogen-III synthase [Bosea sp. TND4EK4]